ncbi:hypothetical protein VE03_01728 [Pseudogymnoascus sp. 23342-1-I1]|nr:hypothetical protein VE03_01728 [Pseudogymnoascus sp. 23342-1-I1]
MAYHQRSTPLDDMAYNPNNNVEYNTHTLQYNPLSPRPSPPTDGPSTSYSSTTASASSLPRHEREESGPSSTKGHIQEHTRESGPWPTDEPSQEPTQNPTQEDGARTPTHSLACYSDYTSASSPSDTSYSPPPLSPLEPSLEYEPYAYDYPSEYSEDTDPEDVEYAPSPSSPREPGLEYATSCPSSSGSDEEEEEEEIASRGRARKRADDIHHHHQNTPEAREPEDTLDHREVAQRTQAQAQAQVQRQELKMNRTVAFALLAVVVVCTVVACRIVDVYARGGVVLDFRAQRE